MARKIEVSPEVRKQLSAEFGISETSVYKALGYVTDSELANKVRGRAIEKGGRKWMTADEKTAEASPKGQREETAFCPDCIVAKYPPCNEHIPCCKCEKKQNECNSWQPCPKKEGKEDAA